MNKKDKKSSGPTCEEISALAYHLYEQEGRPHGRNVEHWLQAELLLTLRAAEKKAADNAAKEVRPTEKKTATAAKMDRSTSKPAPQKVAPQHQATAAVGLFR